MEIVGTVSGAQVRSAEEASRAINVCSLLPREAVRRSAKYRFSLDAIAEIWKRELPAMKKLPLWAVAQENSTVYGPFANHTTNYARNITNDLPPEDIAP